jgi:hypothetical protein
MGRPLSRLGCWQLPGERLAYGAVQMPVEPQHFALSRFADEGNLALVEHRLVIGNRGLDKGILRPVDILRWEFAGRLVDDPFIGVRRENLCGKIGRQRRVEDILGPVQAAKPIGLPGLRLGKGREGRPPHQHEAQ